MKQSNKNINRMLLGVIFLSAISCKSFDPILLEPNATTLNQKLPTLHAVVENNLVAIVSSDGSTVYGANPFDVKTYFEKEVSNILTNPYGEKQGIIKLKVNNYDQRQGMPIFFYLPVLYIPCFFGATAYTYTSSVGVEIEIQTISGKLIGRYDGLGTHKEKVAGMSESYKTSVAPRVAYLKAVKVAVEEAKKKLISDIPRLTTELSKN